MEDFKGFSIPRRASGNAANDHLELLPLDFAFLPSSPSANRLKSGSLRMSTPIPSVSSYFTSPISYIASSVGNTITYPFRLGASGTRTARNIGTVLGSTVYGHSPSRQELTTFAGTLVAAWKEASTFTDKYLTPQVRSGIELGAGYILTDLRDGGTIAQDTHDSLCVLHVPRDG